MAKKDACQMRVSNPILNAPINDQSIQNMQEIIDRHWLYTMPKQAKCFLLETLDISFHGLAKFWSSPSVIEYTRGGVSGRAGSTCGASMFVALNYLKLGKDLEARALTLNGSFFHQCLVSIVWEVLGIILFSPLCLEWHVPLCRVRMRTSLWS